MPELNEKKEIIVRGDIRPSGILATYWLREVVRQSKTPLDAKRLQTTTAPVYGVLRYQVYEWTNNQGQVSENEHDGDADERESRMHLMLHEGCYF
jgi:hypothetical protein